jgi:hypothetical protein|tara:strand:- start:1728 stop:1928 length:201 start_codon:yes stop_codon:yes gene_type:complete
MNKQELLKRLQILQNDIQELKYDIQNNMMDEEVTTSEIDAIQKCVLDIPQSQTSKSNKQMIRTIIC